MDEELIVCRECGRPTCEPPDDLIEFKGLCPGCVIRQEVLPLIPSRFADLVESILEARDDQLAIEIASRLSGKGGVAVILGVGGADDACELLKHTIMHDGDARKKLRDILDMIDKDPPAECEHTLVAKKPVVRNDPRTG